MIEQGVTWRILTIVWVTAMGGIIRAEDDYLTHFTRLDGGFSTRLVISNPTLVSQTYRLIPYDASGSSSVEVSGVLAAQTIESFSVGALFSQISEPSHAVISGGADDLNFSVAYQAVSGISSPAYVEETKKVGRRFRLLPGDWTVIFDGFAVVNTGTRSSDVWVSQIDFDGTIIKKVRALSDVPSMGKGLYVIGSPQGGDFVSVEECVFEVTADEPLAFVALRGTPPGSPSGYLWQNPATRLDVMDDAQLDRFFSLAQIHTINISVTESGVQSLRDEPREYVRASVAIDQAEVMEVAIRLKGKAGSFISMDGEGPSWGEGYGRPGKSAFILDINRYVSGQEYLGLDKLTLNNIVQDPTGIHEFLGYALFRACGVPASRVGYAQVTLNGTLKGLYALIETPDNEEFLDRWYGTDQGNLYEGEYGTDLVEDRIPWFDQDNGSDHSKEDLYTLVAALDSISQEQEVLTVLQTHFDFDAYLLFSVAELFLGHWDGYAWSANNYAIHHNPRDDLWTFQPWGLDQLFEDPMGPFSGVMQGPGPAWMGGGRIHRLCFSSAECRARIATAFATLLALIDEMDLMGLAAQARNVIEPLVLAEAAAFGDPDQTEEAFDRVLGHLAQRQFDINRWLACLTGGQVDHDLDGSDGCTRDCDDFDDMIHPDAQERCNLLDDNCNGAIDDAPGCPKALDVLGPDDHTYRLYFEGTTWLEAQSYCRAQNMELTSIHTWSMAEFLAYELMGQIRVDQSWVGLNDRATEGNFVWSDGTPFDFHIWGSGFPREDEQATDCVVLTPWGLMDIPCDSERPCLCRQP